MLNHQSFKVVTEKFIPIIRTLKHYALKVNLSMLISVGVTKGMSVRSGRKSLNVIVSKWNGTDFEYEIGQHERKLRLIPKVAIAWQVFFMKNRWRVKLCCIKTYVDPITQLSDDPLRAEVLIPLDFHNTSYGVFRTTLGSFWKPPADECETYLRALIRNTIKFPLCRDDLCVYLMRSRKTQQ